MPTERTRDYFFIPTRKGSIPGVRFRADDRPEEETYRDLFFSVTWKQEPEDRAKLTRQGLVHVASDAEAKDFNQTNPELNTKTKVIIPSQLPEVKPGTDEILAVGSNIPTFSGNAISTPVAANNTEDVNWEKRNVYKLSLSTGFKTWLRNGLNWINTKIDAIETAIENINTTVTGIITDLSGLLTSFNGGTTGQIFKKNSNTNGDWSWQDDEGLIIIEVNGTNQLNRIRLPFKAELRVVSNDGATFNSPLIGDFPYTLNANTTLVLDTSGVDKVVVISFVRVYT